MKATSYGAQWRLDDERSDRESPQILLAEDDDEMRAMLASMLRRYDYEVIEASDGLSLITQLEAEAAGRNTGPLIELVISDVRMPGRSGLEVLEGLRAQHRNMPFILITAFGDPETHAAARRLGAIAVLDKPFELDHLRALVCNLLP